MPEDVPLTLSNLELEKALIRALFVYPEEIKQVDIQPDDFYDQRNRIVFEHIRKMDAAGEAVDLETVHNRLIAHKCLEDAGGFPYLIDLQMGMGITDTPQAYGRALVELSTRRRALRQAQEFARAILDRTKPVDETINAFSTSIPNLVKIRGGARHVSYFAERHLERLQEAVDDPEKAAARTMRTGFLDFDAATTGGIRNGELMLVYGKPGLGKTKWVHQLGAQLAKNGYPGVIFQCETSEDEIMDREFSRESKLTTEQLEKGNIAENEWTCYWDAFNLFTGDLPLHLSFDGKWSTTSLRAELTRLKRERKIRWFAFDYLKFLTDSFGDSETERQNYISIQLKRICRDLELAGIVIHSMNKEGISSPNPNLEDGSGGAGISFDCDKALFMVEHLPETGPVYKNYRTFLFRKSRRKITRNIFHLVAFDGYPAFGDVKPPERRPPAPDPWRNDDDD